jgi:hypothetical protein
VLLPLAQLLPLLLPQTLESRALWLQRVLRTQHKLCQALLQDLLLLLSQQLHGLRLLHLHLLLLLLSPQDHAAAVHQVLLLACLLLLSLAEHCQGTACCPHQLLLPLLQLQQHQQLHQSAAAAAAAAGTRCP